MFGECRSQVIAEFHLFQQMNDWCRFTTNRQLTDPKPGHNVFSSVLDSLTTEKFVIQDIYNLFAQPLKLSYLRYQLETCINSICLSAVFDFSCSILFSEKIEDWLVQYAIGWWSSMTVGGRNSRNPKLSPYVDQLLEIHNS